MRRPPARRPHSLQAQRPAGPRKIHPLLTAFPLAVIAVGTLLVVFALAMTSFAGDEDSGVHSSKSASPVAISPAHTP